MESMHVARICYPVVMQTVVVGLGLVVVVVLVVVLLVVHPSPASVPGV
jgi:hypothetical protein